MELFAKIGSTKNWLLCLFLLYPSRPCIKECRIRIKINLNFYFHTSLRCLKRFYEGLKGLIQDFFGPVVFFAWYKTLCHRNKTITAWGQACVAVSALAGSLLDSWALVAKPPED